MWSVDNYVTPVDVSTRDILYVAIYNFGKNDTNYRIIHQGSAQLSCDTSISQARAEIYPNPSAGKLKMRGHNIKSNTLRLELYDSAGKIHLRQFLALNEIIDISNLPSGVFITNIHSDGQLVSSQRIIYIK